MKSLLLTIVASFFISTLTMAQNVPNYVPTNGLVGWWSLNGNANDASVNGNNGTVIGANQTSDRFGNSNAAYDFNGINQYIVIPDNNSLSFTNATYTLGYWVNIRTPILEAGPTICKYGTTFDFEYGNFIYNNHPIRNNSIRFENYNLNGTCGINENELTNSVPYRNNWHHLVSVHNGYNGASLYVDGILFSSNTTSNTSCTMGNGSGNLYFGFGGGWNQQFYFNGKLDDIGIWNRALTQQEITNLYNPLNCANNTTITPQINSLSTGSVATFTATTTDPNPSYVWQSDFGQGFQTLNNFGSYSGTNTATLNINNIQLNNHTQPIRVISISSNCIDTSNVAVINILDTCLVTVYDTLLTTVTDTLGINTQINVNPNPSNGLFEVQTVQLADEILISDVIGHGVLRVIPISTSTSMNLLNQPHGVYFVQVRKGNNVETKRLVIR